MIPSWRCTRSGPPAPPAPPELWAPPAPPRPVAVVTATTTTINKPPPLSTSLAYAPTAFSAIPACTIAVAASLAAAAADHQDTIGYNESAFVIIWMTAAPVALALGAVRSRAAVRTAIKATVNTGRRTTDENRQGSPGRDRYHRKNAAATATRGAPAGPESNDGDLPGHYLVLGNPAPRRCT